MPTTGPSDRDGPLRQTNPWIVLVYLVLTLVLSFIDRQVLTVLIDPIRKSLGITDLQVGMLTGPMFTVCYILGNFLGGLANDRFNRVMLLSVTMATWSIATVTSGFAENFATLVACRSVIGFAEGAVTPTVCCIIADAFDKRRLPVAMAFYSISGSLGSGAAIILGAFVNSLAHVLPKLPVQLEPWQQTFVTVGAPGVLLALMVAVAVRVRSPIAAVAVREGAPRSRVWGFLKERALLVTLYTCGIGLLSGTEFTIITWLPTVFLRVHELSMMEMALTLGPMVIVIGSLGSLFWGGLASEFIRRGRESAPLTILILVNAAALPFVVLAPLVPGKLFALLMVAPVLMTIRSFVGLGQTTLQLVTPGELRGRVTGLYITGAAIIGGSIGPMAVGHLTTNVFRSDESLGVALSIVCCVLSVGGLLCLAACWPLYRRLVRPVPQAPSLADVHDPSPLGV